MYRSKFFELNPLSKNSKAKHAKAKKKKQSPTSSNPKRVISIAARLRNGRARYLDKWDKNANHFCSEGYYDWMASFLIGYTRVLEIGCGNGLSTLNLLQSGHTVVSIDENPSCLIATQNRLKNAGYNPLLLRRETIKVDKQSDSYAITYSKPTIPPNNQITLIESDLINDPKLMMHLALEHKFDAVACWLIGTHMERTYNQGIHVTTNQDYRLLNQNFVYELAEKILRQKGILHIIDRGEGPNSDTITKFGQGHKEAHEDQASVTDLSVKSIDFLEYTELKEEGSIGMVFTKGDEDISEPSKCALVSVISESP